MKRQSADSLAPKRIQTGFAWAICERTRLSLLIILIPRFVAPGANPGNCCQAAHFSRVPHTLIPAVALRPALRPREASCAGFASVQRCGFRNDGGRRRKSKVTMQS